MLVTTYQSTRCHNKESHNIYLRAVENIFSLYLLLPNLSSPSSSSTPPPLHKGCVVLPFQRTANNLSLFVLLSLHLMIYILLVPFGHNLCHLLYPSFLFLVVIPHFAYHAICGVVPQYQYLLPLVVLVY
jgi:hypothetical protein